MIVGDEERHFVRWSSAQVEPVGAFYELRVEVTGGTLSDDWGECLTEEATRRYREQRDRPWGLAGIWRTTLVVQDLDEGCEEDLKGYVNELVAATDVAAAKRRRYSGQARVEADRARARNRLAGEMAERLRSKAGGRGGSSASAVAPALEQLRDYLRS